MSVLISVLCKAFFADHSLPRDDPNRVKDGTIANLLLCAADTEAKILSAARFPLIGMGWNERPHSTDYVAWRATQRMPFAKEDVPLPTGDFMFGGAATAGAVFWWKFPPHGLGMTLRVKTGGLVLIIGRPISPFSDNEACSYESYNDFSLNGLLDSFSATDPSNPAWFSETVYLDATSEM